MSTAQVPGATEPPKDTAPDTDLPKDTAADIDWESFTKQNEYPVPFDTHAEPTKLFATTVATMACFKKGVHEYSSAEDLFEICHEYAYYLQDRSTNDLFLAWQTLIVDSFKEQGPHIIVDPKTRSQLVRHAVQLAATSPNIFGRCLQMNKKKRTATFYLLPFTGTLVADIAAEERHDIVQWLVSFDLLGKAFHWDAWDSVYATSLTVPAKPNDTVIQIHYGKEIVDVSQDAKDSIALAMETMSSNPPIYFNLKQVATSATKTIRVDFLEYSMPQTQEYIDAFDWENIVVGEKDTYPKGKQPTKDEFGKIKSHYMLVKDEKDKKAVNAGTGLLKSGVPGHNHYLSRWAIWRQLCAVYRLMHPTRENAHNHMMSRLKSCKGEPGMWQKLDEDLGKFIKKKKREAKKAEADEKLKEVAAAEKEAKKLARQLEEETVTKEKEIANIEVAPDNMFVSGRSDPKTPEPARHTRRTTLGETKDEALSQAKMEHKKLEDARKKAADEATKKAAEKTAAAERKRQADEAMKAISSPAPNKKMKRNDVARLDLAATPRKKASHDADWSPPTYDKRLKVYTKPGNKWKYDSIRKLRTLSALRKELLHRMLVPQPMTFSTVMEFLDLNDTNSDFNTRVLAFLLCLLISQDSTFDDTIAILLNLEQRDCLEVGKLAHLTVEQVTTEIICIDSNNRKGQEVYDVVQRLVAKYSGVVPAKKQTLVKDLKIPDAVASQLMMVFGCVELVVDIHARKILAALDMVDWEETGTDEKSQLGMTRLTADKVKKSLCTWLPKGERATFHITMQSIGALLAAKAIGDWGRIQTAINTHFKDKDTVLTMCETISQVYKATRGSGKTKNLKN